MMKKLGMSSEEVCEIGKWKNVTAFTSHYLRLNASHTLGTKISKLVHKVSPLRSAEADLTWTTRKYDLGGNVREAEAQNNGEPTLPPLNVDSLEPGWPDNMLVDTVSLEHAPWLSSHLDSLPSEGDEPSENACLAPPSFPLPFAADTVSVCVPGPPTARSLALKRKRSAGGSPPSKFAFAAQKPKER